MKEINYDQLSIEELETLLQADFQGIKKLPPEEIMAICEVLIQKNPELRKVIQESRKRFEQRYLKHIKTE